MIEFEQFELNNGLRVIVHQDKSTTLAAINILYDVGSRDEDENKTGFAHLFEHLMFGGSKHIDNYDHVLQKVGGENNAFTTPDITNYYMTLPAVNLETGFWLESDRMLSLSFNPEVLEVQRKVVIEEFNQRYLNEPYGDVWLKLRPLAYREHPYRWATIGKEVSHIEQAKMEDVKNFFNLFYAPNNAVLVVAGNVELGNVKRLSEKYFGDIPRGETNKRALPAEPQQLKERFLETEADVPLNAVHKVFHMPARATNEYYVADLLSDLVGRGKSSRLYDQLVKKDQLFNSINAYVTGSFDPGLMVVTGKLNKSVDFATADNRIWEVINDMVTNGPGEVELNKVKNQAMTSIEFGAIELLNRAMNLALGAVMGNVDLANQESKIIERITKKEIHAMSRKVLKRENCSTLYYKSNAA